MRSNSRNRRASGSGRRVAIATVAEMQHIRDQLALAAGNPSRQAAAIELALKFKDHYFYAGRCLRRVFPKSGDVVAFHSAPQSKSGQAMAAHFSGGQDAADQSQADPLRDQ